MEGFRSLALRAVSLGFEGKWAIHPSQIEEANELFNPSKDEITRARQILVAMREAEREGRAAVSLDGRMIDIASIRQAEVMVKMSRHINALKKTKSDGGTRRKSVMPRVKV